MFEVCTIIVNSLRKEFGIMNHRKDLSNVDGKRFCLYKQNHVIVERVHSAISLILIILLEIMFMPKCCEQVWNSIGFRIYWVLAVGWIAAELVIVGGLEYRFRQKVSIHSRFKISTVRLNCICFLLSVINCLTNILFIFLYPLTISMSEFTEIYLLTKIILIAASICYSCFLVVLRKSYFSCLYSTYNKSRFKECITAIDIAVVCNDGEVIIPDVSKQTLDLGFGNDVLLIEDQEVTIIALDRMRAVIFANGEDFNKAVVPNGTDFVVKDLINFANLKKGSAKTDADVLELLNVNSI